jgi:hypothetical protein
MENRGWGTEKSNSTQPRDDFVSWASCWASSDNKVFLLNEQLIKWVSDGRRLGD